MKIIPVDPFVLAAKLGVDITNTDGRANGSAAGAGESSSQAETEPIDLDDHPQVAEELAEANDPPDRSKDTHRIIAACIDAGLTLPQTRWVINQRDDLAARIVEFVARTPPVDDVLRSWEKLRGERFQEVQSLGPAAGTSQATGGNTNAGAGTNSSNTGGDKPLPDGLGPTDVGNAARLIRHAGHQLRYVHAWGKWLVYIDGRWILDEKDALVTELANGVSAALFTLGTNCVATHGKKEAKRVLAWALRTCSASSIAAMVKSPAACPA